MDEIVIKVPARICFFGDHQDYLGLPVIAGSINRFITLRANPINENRFQIELKDLNRMENIDLSSSFNKVPKDDYFRSGMAILIDRGFKFNQGFQIEISGNIPLNAGLSSSSALVVAWIRFLISTQTEISFTYAEIGHLAYEAEVGFFKQPGGLMDQYTIAQQGLLFIDTTTGKTEPLKGALVNLVVAESGIEKKTLDVLKNARNYQEEAIAHVKSKNPDFEIKDALKSDYDNYLDLVPKEYQNHWYAAIHNYHITKEAATILRRGNDLSKLFELMNLHQEILYRRIQNTPDEMAFMMKSAKMAGATAAKTIGSGGGGAMVALVEENKIEDVKNAFMKAGAKTAYEVQLTYPEP